MQLDRTNLMILDALQQNGRLTVSDLARLLGRGESTVRDRLVSMQRNGVLRGFRAMVDPASLGHPVHAIVRARCEGKAAAELARLLQAVPEVVGAWFTTGPHPVRIEVRAKSLEDLGALMEERLVPLGLKAVEVVIALQTLVESRPVPAQSGLARAGAQDVLGGELALMALSAAPQVQPGTPGASAAPQPATSSPPTRQPIQAHPERNGTGSSVRPLSQAR